MGLLYERQQGRVEGKKERVWKECGDSVLKEGTCQGFMPRWPQLSKPFASFAKVPTRDPEILPCYWLYVVRNLYLQSKYTHISIHTRSHATGKIILVSCTHTFQKLILHLFFLLPKCSISIREGNGKFASTCTKAHIINYKKILCSLNRSLIWIFYSDPEHTFPKL